MKRSKPKMTSAPARFLFEGVSFMRRRYKSRLVPRGTILGSAGHWRISEL